MHRCSEGVGVMGPMGLFPLPDHLTRLPKTGDPLEVMDQVMDFEQFKEPLERAWGRIRRSAVAHAECYDGTKLAELATSDDLAARVWVDMAYRPAANEAWLQ